MKMSLLTTCRGRLMQLRETLPRNLEENAADRELEFIVVDYDSRDGLGDWVRTAMAQHIESGRLTYVKFSPAPFYNSPHSKNIAHRMALGEIVVDINADTWAPAALLSWIRETVGTPAPSYARCLVPSTMGLIGMKTSDFYRLGGYDERLHEGYGHDDDSLAHRANGLGYAAHFIPDKYCGCIRHGDGLRVENMQNKDILASGDYNTDLTEKDLARGIYVANRGISWGAGEVEINFKTRVRLG